MEIIEYSIQNLQNEIGELVDFRFSRLSDFVKKIDHLTENHRHSFYSFILVTEGSGTHTIDFKKYDLKPNRLFVIGKEQVLAWSEVNNLEGFVILFTDEFISLTKEGSLISDWPVFKIGERNYFDLTESQLNYWIAESSAIQAKYLIKDEFRQESLFYSLGNLLVNASRLLRDVKGKIANTSDFLYSFQELIESNFIQFKLPKDYADRLNVSPNYLNALCKQLSGKSAGELIRQRVLLEAKRMLTHTSLSISEISYALGFNDNSYFGRYFLKYVGMTPANYRRSQNKVSTGLN